MQGEIIGVGESIEATVIKATPDFSITPIILFLSFLFFIFLCYMAWNKRNDAQMKKAHIVRQFGLEDNQ
jgi:hypothetical protein